MSMAVRSRDEVTRDITQTLGLAPSFFEALPDEVLDHARELFKR